MNDLREERKRVPEIGISIEEVKTYGFICAKEAVENLVNNTDPNKVTELINQVQTYEDADTGRRYLLADDVKSIITNVCAHYIARQKESVEEYKSSLRSEEAAEFLKYVIDDGYVHIDDVHDYGDLRAQAAKDKGIDEWRKNTLPDILRNNLHGDGIDNYPIDEEMTIALYVKLRIDHAKNKADERAIVAKIGQDKEEKVFMWAARDINGDIYIHTCCPTLIKESGKFVTESILAFNREKSYKLPSGLFKEVTFGNSPVKVELKIVEDFKNEYSNRTGFINPHIGFPFEDGFNAAKKLYKNDWISVEDDLPEQCVKVNVKYEYSSWEIYITSAFYSSGEFILDDSESDFGGKVTHWKYID